MNLKALGEKIGFDEHEYRELAELFLETGMADFHRLKGAIDMGDVQQAARSAHTIKGAAGNLGIMNIHDMVKRIELAVVENRLDSVVGDMDLLKGSFDALSRVLNLDNRAKLMLYSPDDPANQ
ncbi:Hpt domain-containing protein [Desulfosarcina sp.]|uniref:Hpt domain-containing protein n=1 Tax=Desulfosarcina sp. TaxID=2027861 RepID=UPI003970C34A